MDAIDMQLPYEAFIETRNRKRLRPNPLAGWELRVGAIRVFYDLAPGNPNVVLIVAIGLKQGNKLIIEGNEVKYKSH